MSFFRKGALIRAIYSSFVYVTIQNYLVIKLCVKDEQIFFYHVHSR